MKTLVNKNNPAIRIIAPEITTAHPPVSNEGYVYWIPAINQMYNPINWTLVEEDKQMPDSTQLVAEWEKEKAMLEQKDFRGDAERMAYNAFLDGFVKGLGYESTR